MIDWLTFQAPLPHKEQISSGMVLSLNAEGEIQWRTSKRHAVKGSFSTDLQIRTCEHTEYPCTHVEISGNPVKFFQGHNLWGTDDLHGLVLETLEMISSTLGIEVSADTRALWLAGDIRLTRVDCTDSFHLSSIGEVRAWLRAADQTAHIPHRGRGQLGKGGTLYFGKKSRRWSLKLYAKGDEIFVEGHGQESILDLPSAIEWARKTLRAELTLRGMELDNIGLRYVRNWMPIDEKPLNPVELLKARLETMTMTTTQNLSEEILSELTNAQRTAYLAWIGGNDLREVIPMRSFYRLRRKLLPHGVDIATLLPKEISNVVPLYRVLEAKPAVVPDWAYGTPLFYEPRRIAQ